MIDSNNDLTYSISEKKIKISEFYEPKSHLFDQASLSKYKELSFKRDYKKGKIEISSKDITFYVFIKGIEYEIYKNKVKGILYSDIHLDKLIEKYSLIKPIIREVYNNQYIAKEDIINIDDKIIILERENIIDIKMEYNKLILLYNNIKTSYSLLKNINIDILSPNYHKYFLNKNYGKIESKEIPIFWSNNRDLVLRNVFSFLDDNSKIYALCGPYGIGKTFTSLLIQKELFKEGINSLYINLGNNEEIQQLKLTLIKELFFLNLNENKYEEESSKILENVYNDVWGIINEIDSYCQKNNIKYLLILDQYQKEKDKNNLIVNLKTKKIFLLSSINDEDVKDNLFLKGNNSFKYTYLNNFKIDKSIENFIADKSPNIQNCIKLFNFIPLSIFLLENIFNWNILDFLNSQFWIVLKQLSEFYEKNIIDFISKLKDENKINSFDDIIKKEINKKDFIDNIKDISLKYISFEIQSEIAKLYYAFNYVKYILEFEIEYIFSKKSILSKCEKYIKGGDFEKIIRHKFILEKNELKIDGFIAVNKIVNMILEDEYKFIKNEELQKKNCIFIWQTQQSGEYYDFAFLYPKINEIILAQAKYKITYDNVKEISFYSNREKVKTILNALEKLEIKVNKIFILYLSSVEFNTKEAFKVLEKKKINCLFYNITKNIFTSNFKNDTKDFKSLSSEIYPKVKEYKAQYYEKSKRFEQVLLPAIKRIQKERKKENEGKLKEEYTNFINFLKSKNIKNELLEHLGKFYCRLEGSIEFPILSFTYYLFFFKLKLGHQINYDDELFIVHEENNKLFYYDVKNQIESKMQIEKLISNFNLIIGFWKTNIGLDLEEEE